MSHLSSLGAPVESDKSWCHSDILTSSMLVQRARQQRSEAKSKKLEAQRKNTKVQQISNPATIKKMMKDKKQRKKLMTADPEKAAKGHA